MKFCFSFIHASFLIFIVTSNLSFFFFCKTLETKSQLAAQQLQMSFFLSICCQIHFPTSSLKLFFQPLFLNLFFSSSFSTSFFWTFFFNLFFSTFFFNLFFSTSFFQPFFSTSFFQPLFFNLFFLDFFSQLLLSISILEKTFIKLWGLCNWIVVNLRKRIDESFFLKVEKKG